MKQIIITTIAFVILLGLLGLAGCKYIENNNPGNQYPTSVSLTAVEWTKAIEILNSGQVAEVFQSHDLVVVLTLKDGSRIKTVEPAIDDIFRAIEFCGRACAEIVLVTE